MGQRGIPTPAELKAEAVRSVIEGKLSRKAAAKQCAVSYTSLCSWVNAELKKEESGADEDLLAQVQRLKAENRELKMEREILKKATAFFAKENR